MVFHTPRSEYNYIPLNEHNIPHKFLSISGCPVLPIVRTLLANDVLVRVVGLGGRVDEAEFMLSVCTRIQKR